MAEFPAMPFWFDAYYGDTAHLTYEEHGLYIKLLSLLWRAPGQHIPNDPAWIERRFKEYTPQVMKLIDEFCQCDGNWISKKRVTREYNYLIAKRNRRSVAAKARWAKEKASHNADAPTPTPTPTPTQESKEVLVGAARPNKGSRLPMDWRPSVEGKAFADSLLGTEQSDQEIEKFLDYWIPLPGQRGVKLDWQRTWKNWCRNAKTGGFNGSRGSRPLQDDRLSASRAAGRLAEAARRGEFSLGPRPGLLSRSGQADVFLLPKGRGS